MGIRIKKIMGYSLSLKEIADSVCEPNMSWDDCEFLEDGGRWQAMCDEILSFDYSAQGVKDPFLLERVPISLHQPNAQKPRRLFRN